MHFVERSRRVLDELALTPLPDVPINPDGPSLPFPSRHDIGFSVDETHAVVF